MALKAELEELLAQALHKLQGGCSTPPSSVAPSSWSAPATRSTATSAATSRCAWPRRPAASRASWRPRSSRRCPPSALLARTEVAGAGFINLYLVRDAHGEVLRRVLAQGERYGTGTSGAALSVCVEFVSANPTGPLHVGHGRQAAYGASLANLLERHRPSRAPRVLHQRRAAGRSTSSRPAPGCATCRRSAKRCRSRKTATAPTT